MNIDTEKGDTFDLVLAFYGPKGSSFGQVLNLKVKVTEQPMNQERLFRAAITLTEANIANFDDCVEALKKFKGDENAACAYLIDEKNTLSAGANKH